MSFNLEPGLEGYSEQVVTHDLSASNYGSGLVEVFATPAMIALMENTCHRSIQPYLPEGFITVGSAVNVRHLKATPVGKKVWCKSKLTVAEGRKLEFIVEAWDDHGLIGTGSHERYIVHAETFLNRITHTG